MSRVDTTRDQIYRLVQARPFQRFLIALESGDRVLIEHPENISFDPESNGRDEFSVITGRVRLYSTFSAVSSIALADQGGAAA